MNKLYLYLVDNVNEVHHCKITEKGAPGRKDTCGGAEPERQL